MAGFEKWVDVQITARWLLAGCAVLSFVRTVDADDWTQFRGPNATGVYSGQESLPVEFSSEKNVKWSVPIGRGVACPVIAKGRAFMTWITGKTAEDSRFVVGAFDAQSGKPLWKSEFPTGALPDITSPNEHASSTPATDGERVYVHFSTIGLLTLNAADGKLLWKYPLPQPFYLLGWGAANSPIVFEDMVLFNLDDDLNAYLLAVDKYTGRKRWYRPRPEMLGGFAVPVLCQAGGRTDVVVAGSGKLKGYDPKTGQQRWTCNSLLRTIMTTPAVQGDTIYVSCQSYGDTSRVLKFALLQWRDTNQDGRLAKDELDKVFWKKFDKGDSNGDGFLVDDEIDQAFQAPTNMVGGGNIIQAIRGGGSGDVTKSHMRWNLDNKSPSNIASPLAFDGRLFMVKKGGISASFGLADGKTVWTRKRIRNLGNYYASPIAGDGKLYVTGENGYIVVLKSGPKPVVLAKNDMGNSCVATPAIADGCLYIRTLDRLFCVSEGGK